MWKSKMCSSSSSWIFPITKEEIYSRSNYYSIYETLKKLKNYSVKKRYKEYTALQRFGEEKAKTYYREEEENIKNRQFKKLPFTRLNQV